MDEGALLSYLVLSRRWTTRPAKVTSDEAALFNAIETVDDAAGPGDCIDTPRPIANIINPVSRRITAWSSQGQRSRHHRQDGACRRIEAWCSQGRLVAEDGDMGLIRTMSIINIIKLLPRRTDTWSSRDDTTDVYLIKTEPATRSHEDNAHYQHHQAGATVDSNMEPATR